MKILHTSDWHIGRTFHGVDLHGYQAAYLDHLCDVVDSCGIDAVLVSGDVYDRAVPSVASVQVLADGLAKLTSRTRVIITPGNHDSAVRLGFAAELMTDRLQILADVGSIGRPIEVSTADAPDVAIYGLPYLDPDATRAQLGDGENIPDRSHEAVLTAAMNTVRADAEQRPGAVTIVMAHAFVAGGEPSDSERDIRVGGVDVVPARVFDNVDYVALGHLHSPQRIAGDADGPLIRYSGSPLPYSFSEQGRHKSSTLLTIDSDQGDPVISAELIPAPAPYRLDTITGTMDELMTGFAEARAHWLRIRVTDSRYPDGMYAQLKDRFPAAMDIQHTPAHRSETAQTPQVTPESDPLQVCAEFIEYVTGVEATTAENDAFAAAYEAVRASAGSR